MEYKTVMYVGNSDKGNIEGAVQKFDEKVNEQIKNGWKPQGGVNLIETKGIGKLYWHFSLGMIK